MWVINSNQNKIFKTNPTVTISDLLDHYLMLNPDSKILSRKNSYNSFRKSFETCPLKYFDKNNVRFWFKHIKEVNQYSDKNMNRIKSNINSFISWLIEEDYLQQNPLLKVKYKRNLPPKRERIILSKSEIKELLERLKEHSPAILFPIIYTVIHTGARRSEVLNLSWEDLDFNNGFINFRNTKNGENRRVKMSNSLFLFLKNHPKTSEFLFTDKNNKQIGRGLLSTRLKKFKKLFLAQKDWKCHDLRHSFAYNFLKKGGEMYQLKAILGHKSIQMTIDLYGNLKAADIENPSPYEF